MRKFFFMAVAAIAVLSACTKEEARDQHQAKFTGTIDQNISTKTSLGEDGLSVQWNAGDEISINGVIYRADLDGTNSTFTAVDSEVEVSDTYCAFYPSSYSNSEFPETQYYKDGSISNLPMYAISSDKNLTFKNVCAVLAVKVTTDVCSTVRSIVVSSSNHYMSGDFSLSKDGEDSESSYSLVVEDGKGYSITLDCGNGVSVPSDGKTFYIAVPVNTYQDLNIKVTDGLSNYYEMTTKSGMDIEVSANTIYPINFVAQESFVEVPKYFCLTNVGQENAFIDLHLSEEMENIPYFEYCYADEYDADADAYGDMNWQEYRPQLIDTFNSISLESGRSLYLRAKDENKALDHVRIASNQEIEASGNIMTLLNGKNPATEFTSENEYAFYKLFIGCTKLVGAKNLLLPATTLVGYCYAEMFSGCTYLESVSLPATNIPKGNSLNNWLKGAGVSATNPTLYVASSMVENSTIITYKGSFTIKAKE